MLASDGVATLGANAPSGSVGKEEADEPAASCRGRTRSRSGLGTSLGDRRRGRRGGRQPDSVHANVLAQGLFRLEEYDPVAEVVSALEAGPGGWVQQVNFMVFGLLTIAFVVGLHLGLRPTRWGFIGPSLLVLSGMALVWPQRSRCARTPPALPTTLVCTSWA